MNHYVGIDVSLEASSECVVDCNGKIVCESKIVSEPKVLITWLKGLKLELTRIGSRTAVAMALCGDAPSRTCGRAARDAACAQRTQDDAGEDLPHSRDGDQSFQMMVITGSRDRDYARRHAPTDVLMLCGKWCFGQGLAELGFLPLG
jgi:hypothetical protein